MFPIFAALRNRPTLIGEIKRSSGVIRRDFEYALFLKKEDLAKQYLDEWRAGNRLDAENSSYLEIHLNLSLGNSLFILQNDYQKLREIRDLNVPPSIRQQVSEVLHNLVLSNPAELNDWREVQSAYSEERLSYFSNFFDVQTIQSLESLVLATLDEVFKLEPDRKKLKWLTSREAIDGLPIIRSISEQFLGSENRQLAEVSEEPLQIAQVEELIRKNEFASAFAGVLKLEKTESSLRLLTQILRQTLNDVDKQKGEAVQAINYWDNTPEDLRDQLVTSAPFEFQIFADLRGMLDSLPQSDQSVDKDDLAPGTWSEWFALLDGNLSDSMAKGLFHKHYKTWSVSAFSDEPDALIEFVEHLGGVPEAPQKNQLIDELFPQFLEDFIGDQDNFDDHLKPIYFKFLEILTLNANHLDLQVIAEVQSLIFDCHLTVVETDELLELLVTALKENRTYQNLYMFLDTAELISLNVDVTNNAAISYFHEVRNLSVQFAHRLDDEQLHVLKMIFQDFGVELDELFADREEDKAEDISVQSHVDLNGKTIGIYSLVDDAAKRASDYLNAKFPNISIKLNNDKQCTDRLRHLAKNADIFVFASKASKHQAFYCIKNNRPTTLADMLIPVGKGSSSIIRSLINGA